MFLLNAFPKVQGAAGLLGLRYRAALLCLVGVNLLLAGCASGYRQNLFLNGGGYNESKIDDTTYLVSFNGNGYTSSDRVWNFWIYRCAELTKEKGYANFTLSQIPAKSSMIDAPEHASFAGDYADSGWGFVKVKGSTAPTTIYTPGTQITTWSSKAIVKMFNATPPAGSQYGYKAQSILDTLHSYVESDGKTQVPDKNTILRSATVVFSSRPVFGT
jgi:hypothetical protein